MSKKAIHWSGVFPAVTTQFRSDYSLDLDATHAVMKNLVRDGVSGLVVCGSVGENTSLTTQEKLQIIEVAKDAAGGQIPVIAGVAEFTTAFAQKMAKEAERVGVDGIMVMPALVYSSKPHETAAHFRSVATATDLPIMVYNNPANLQKRRDAGHSGDAHRLRQHRLLQRLLRRYPPFYRPA